MKVLATYRYGSNQTNIFFACPLLEYEYVHNYDEGLKKNVDIDIHKGDVEAGLLTRILRMPE